MANPTYEVRAQWDDEAKVWVAESDDLPGLVAEASDVPELINKLRVLIPELLEENGALAASNAEELDLRLTAAYHERIKLGNPV